ncbi:hypothetical protein EB796_019693 [Bugula neritina]|uniref:Uncharacterized protein n=1 Tax=Bugula neritina TaxID=10212 RepID=A0A7J7J8D9_BUGNE|nr:hypothetical protein EB796_019693 [Bugula neritina]
MQAAVILYYSKMYTIHLSSWYIIIGRCIQYKYEGDVCNTWASLQECGCADGLICKLFVPSDLESPELKRAILPWFIPNSDYACMVDTPAQ